MSGPDAVRPPGQSPSEPSEPSGPSGSPARRRTRRGGKAAGAALALATGGTLVFAWFAVGGDDSQGSQADGLPPGTAAVTKQTLRATRTEDGELGYGPSTPVTGRLSGTFTALPAEGKRIGRGGMLYELDNRPVVLMYGAKPAFRELATGVEGPDVEQLEANLLALGYTGFTVDEEFSELTAEAVRQWQEDEELPGTGKVELGRVVFAPGEVRVESRTAAEGRQSGPGGEVLTYTGTAKAVTVELDSADRQLAGKGTKVTVRLPDDSTAAGTVTDVSTEVQPATDKADAETKVNLVVGLEGAKAQKSAAAYEQAAVQVDFTTGTRRDVLTVPVAALLVLPQGGFGVEVVDETTSTTRYVPVTTGLFAGGKVEVSGDGITEGVTVGMPK
ncbi:peptidoglycan-binding protein [Streptomyces sp. CMB-StM0423]|uniref:peptidoglycan-binding protein n=1 Tax=Streptomyces sp. CMB-StM0423 TaxID=2059884 RepID=UPI000C704A9B|nr:peptidoglycan-binding protein [Streptomyces sp. CMB-StM0423]AUH40004.1 peptidoglycan-binding protein [Streptomyces sp. CMB-StM0423]